MLWRVAFRGSVQTLKQALVIQCKELDEKTKGCSDRIVVENMISI